MILLHTQVWEPDFTLKSEALSLRLQYASEPSREFVNHNLVKRNWTVVWATVFLASSLGDSDIHQRSRMIDLRNS